MICTTGQIIHSNEFKRDQHKSLAKSEAVISLARIVTDMA
jgi:hypothetical protein